MGIGQGGGRVGKILTGGERRRVDSSLKLLLGYPHTTEVDSQPREADQYDDSDHDQRQHLPTFAAEKSTASLQRSHSTASDDSVDSVMFMTCIPKIEIVAG